MTRNLSFLTRFFPLGRTAAPVKGDIDCKRFDPNPENPNRCMLCLVKQGGTPNRRYWPASDSMFFDTGVCGSCGDFNEVCDPPLLDAYSAEGLNLSMVSQSMLYDKRHQLVRLRFRRDPEGPATGIAHHYEDATMEQAVHRVRE